MSQTLCYCLSRKTLEVLCIQERLFSKNILRLQFEEQWLLILRVKTFDKLIQLLHAWSVNVLSGVPFLWEGRVGKGAGYLQDGQYQLTTQLGKPLEVLTEPENKLGWCKSKCLVLKTFFYFSQKRMTLLMNISSTNSWWSWLRKQHPPNVYFFICL